MANLIIITITLHFIFDWVLQPRCIAKSKKMELSSLFIHMLINILPFSYIMAYVLFFIFDYAITDVIGILAINFVSHFLIDLLLPSGNNERQMINWTAVDQILHINILIMLLQYS